jgi:hypothetical protein
MRPVILAATLSLLGSASQGAGDGLKAEYFAKAGGKFEGTPVLTRVDRLIDFSWGTAAPDPAVGADDFTVRWTGWIQAPSSEAFQLHVFADDGVRLWIDDVLIIDDWPTNAALERSGKATLVDGRRHAIRLELRENGGHATARLFWSSPTTPKQIVPTSALYSQIPDPASLAPVPSAEDQKKVEGVVKDLYKKEYAAKSVDDRKALALELLQKGLEANDDLTTRYVMLREAKDLAAGAGDVATALRACDALSARHAVDPFPLKIAALDKGKQAASTEAALKELATRYLALWETSVAADQYEHALDCLKKVQGLGKDAVLAPFVATAKEREKPTSDLKREYQKVAASAATLREKPDDPAANLALGRFLCFEKDEWDSGLRHLAKGSDEALKRLADLEGAGASTSDERAALADGWYTIGEKEKTASARQAAYSRSTTWYYRALTDASALKKLQIERRLKELAKKTSGSAVNLLAMIDPKKDAVAGTWIIEGGTLALPGGNFLRLQVPYEPPEECELRVRVARKSGEGGFVIGLVTGGRQFLVSIEGRRPNGASHIQLIDGRGAPNESEAKGPVLSDENPRELQCSVRKNLIRITSDGRPVLQWTGEAKQLSLPGGWTVPNAKALFLASWDTSYAISSLTLVPVTGQGKPLR